jgi:hypothetical protein
MASSASPAFQKTHRMKAALKRSADYTFPMKPLDAKGRRIRVGDRVRIVGTPDLSTIASDAARLETGAVFRHIRGTCKRVARFNKYGLSNWIL